MSKYWNPSRNGKKDFEEIYYDYKAGKITQTEAAYLQKISVPAFKKRIAYYEKNNATHYDNTTKEEKIKANKLMEKHIDKIKRFATEQQEQITDALYKTCLYIVRNRQQIKNENALIWFCLKRKARDIKYEYCNKKEITTLELKTRKENYACNDTYIYDCIKKSK